MDKPEFYTDKVDRVLAVIEAMSFTVEDFENLCRVCADQAGMSIYEQGKLEKLLDYARARRTEYK